MDTSTSKDRGVSAPLIVTAGATVVTMATFVALIIAGIAAGDLFSGGGSASDQGVWAATRAWATPLAVGSVGVIFGVAIPLALHNVRSAIDHRRNAMVTGLPTLIQGAQS
jgi:hypothetical protein